VNNRGSGSSQLLIRDEYSLQSKRKFLAGNFYLRVAGGKTIGGEKQGHRRSDENAKEWCRGLYQKIAEDFPELKFKVKYTAGSLKSHHHTQDHQSGGKKKGDSGSGGGSGANTGGGGGGTGAGGGVGNTAGTSIANGGNGNTGNAANINATSPALSYRGGDGTKTSRSTLFDIGTSQSHTSGRGKGEHADPSVLLSNKGAAEILVQFETDTLPPEDAVYRYVFILVFNFYCPIFISY
jgi:hypothetical protein